MDMTRTPPPQQRDHLLVRGCRGRVYLLISGLRSSNAVLSAVVQIDITINRLGLYTMK